MIRCKHGIPDERMCGVCNPRPKVAAPVAVAKVKAVRPAAAARFSHLDNIVYDDLTVHPHSTQGEVAERVKDTHGHDRPSVTPRFSALKKQGRAISTGIRQCRVTGFSCLTWAINDGQAQPFTRPSKVLDKLNRIHEYVKDNDLSMDPDTIILVAEELGISLA
jgi:hypothetical protein